MINQAMSLQKQQVRMKINTQNASHEEYALVESIVKGNLKRQESNPKTQQSQKKPKESFNLSGFKVFSSLESTLVGNFQNVQNQFQLMNEKIESMSRKLQLVEKSQKKKQRKVHFIPQVLLQSEVKQFDVKKLKDTNELNGAKKGQGSSMNPQNSGIERNIIERQQDDLESTPLKNPESQLLDGKQKSIQRKNDTEEDEKMDENEKVQDENDDKGEDDDKDEDKDEDESEQVPFTILKHIKPIQTIKQEKVVSLTNPVQSSVNMKQSQIIALIQKIVSHKTKQLQSQIKEFAPQIYDLKESAQKGDQDQKIINKIKDIQNISLKLSEDSQPTSYANEKTQNPSHDSIAIELQSQIEDNRNKEVDSRLHNEVPQSVLLQKVKQMSKTLTKVLEDQLVGKRSNTNKFYQLETSISGLENNLEKQANRPNPFVEEVEKLRCQLQEYKLKKENKYLKLLAQQSPKSKSGQHTPSNGKGNDQLNEYLEFLSEKVNFLLKTNRQFVSRLDYSTEIEKIHEIFYSIRKKLSENIPFEDAEKMVNFSRKKVIEDISKIFEDDKAKNSFKQHFIQFKEKNRDSQESSSTDKNNENEPSESKNGLRSKVSNIQEQIEELNKALNKMNLTDIPTLKESLQSVQQEQLPKLSDKLSNHEDFFKRMNEFYNAKFKESEEQIIDQQEQMEKVQSQLKFYKFTSGDGKHHFVSSSTVMTTDKMGKNIHTASIDELMRQQEIEVGLNTEQVDKNDDQTYQKGERRSTFQRYKSHPIDPLNSELSNPVQDGLPQNDKRKEINLIKNRFNLKKSTQKEKPKINIERLASIDNNLVSAANNIILNPELNFEISSLKKKVSKMYIKFDNLKVDMANLKDALLKEIQEIKSNEEKKTDWESFKKGMGYFDDKLKETNRVLDEVIETFNKEEENGDEGRTVAAKKKWTCLCCDKDLKNYEGKLGEAKFMSVFPNRFDSPRVGGYYKQSSKDKQYQQLYLNKAKQVRGSSLVNNAKYLGVSKDEEKGMSLFG